MSQRDRRRPVWPLRKARVLLAAVLVGGSVGWAVGAAPAAKADPVPGCETLAWPNLLNWAQKRTICDGPVQADGSWWRGRELWTPAGYVRGSGYCGTYSCSFSEGYYRERSTHAYAEYLVFPHNVLRDEPGHLPAGSVAIR